MMRTGTLGLPSSTMRVLRDPFIHLRLTSCLLRLYDARHDITMHRDHVREQGLRGDFSVEPKLVRTRR